MNLIDRLEQHNAWRRGETDDSQPHPTQIGKDIDEAIAKLAAADRLAEAVLAFKIEQGGTIRNEREWYAVMQAMFKARESYQSQTKETP